MKIIKTFLLFGVMFFITACSASNKIYLFEEKELADSNLVILHETAIIDSLENEYIQMNPQENNVLLVSVLELMNQMNREIDINSYVKRTVTYQKTDFPSKAFSLDGEKIRTGNQAYVYLISEIPYSALEDIESKKSIVIEFNLGDQQLHYKSHVNNNYGLQDNITNKYPKIKEFEKEFEKYWAEDLKGFRVYSSEREKIKNYNQIYDWVESTQKKYTATVQILDMYLNNMSHMQLATPIYPDAHIKILLETHELRNNLNAIIEAENTCIDSQGVELFIENCHLNLQKASELNSEQRKKIKKEIRKEQFAYVKRK